MIYLNFKPMYFLPISLLFLSNLLFGQSSKLISVTIKCTQTSDYCGGAQPTEEMLIDVKTPIPNSNVVYYIVKGAKRSGKVFKKITANENGIVSIRLPKGKYAILTASQIEPYKARENDNYTIWDQQCLKQKYDAPVLLLVVGKKQIFTINIHNPCFYNPYCGQYSGPLPP
jgi:hypothetical protein